MTNRKIWRLLAVFLSMAMLVAACGDDDDGDSADGDSPSGTASDDTAANGGGGLPDSVTIGVIDSLSGPAAFCGENEVQGMELAVEDAAEQGLLGDTEIKLEVQDDASTSEGGVSSYRNLLSQDVAAIAGPCFSAAAQAIVPLADDEGVPIVLTTAGGADFPVPEFVYRSGIPQTQFANLTADAMAERDIESVGVIFQNDNEAIVDLWNNDMKPRFEELGVEVKYEDGVAGTTADFSPQIAKYNDDPPDAIGVLVVGGANVTIVTQVRESGLDLPLFGQLAMAAPFFVENSGEAANGTIFAVNFHPGFEFASSQDFSAGYEEKFGVEPDYAAANGYDSVYRIILALQAADSADPEDVKAALDDLSSMDGAQGPLTFLDDGDVTGEAGVVEVVDLGTNLIFGGGS